MEDHRQASIGEIQRSISIEIGFSKDLSSHFACELTNLTKTEEFDPKHPETLKSTVINKEHWRLLMELDTVHLRRLMFVSCLFVGFISDWLILMCLM